MSPISAHSVWLVPDRAGDVFSRLRGLIDRLAQQADGDAFDPHVTLVGSLDGAAVELAGLTRSLAESLTAYEIALGQIVARPREANRYRRLFARVERSRAVMAANAAARAAFAAHAGEGYAPHLSLAYADAPPAAFEAMRTEALHAGLDGLRFEARTLELWRTAGPVADWRLQASFPIRAFSPGGA